jgi:hypothetical protein
MFPQGYFPDDYFTHHYWAKVGGAPVGGAAVAGRRYMITQAMIDATLPTQARQRLLVEQLAKMSLLKKIREAEEEAQQQYYRRQVATAVYSAFLAEL